MMSEDLLTNEQAINEMKAMREHLEPYMSVIGLTAYDMAIKALGSWRKYSEKLWQQAYDRGVKDGILFTMDKECNDCISREEVIKLLEKEDWADTVEGVLELPPVQPPGKELYDCFKVGAAIQNIVSRVDKETLEQIKEYLGEIEAIVRGDTDDD